MKISHPHPPWPKTIGEAKTLQAAFAERVVIAPLAAIPVTVTAVDAAFSDDRVIAVAASFEFESLKFLEQTHCVRAVTFPYVPGYLTFREGPAIACAIRKLSAIPDLLLVDGQGIAHPRMCGIASHLGVLLDAPTIGCAKSRLVGSYTEPDARKGSWAPLVNEHGVVIGAALRTRDRVKPLFVSPGHRITLGDAIRVTLHCTGRFRIPEPLRIADALTKKLRDKLLSGVQ
jgi:deoxyribonuclease V